MKPETSVTVSYMCVKSSNHEKVVNYVSPWYLGRCNVQKMLLVTLTKVTYVQQKRALNNNVGISPYIKT